MTFSQTLGSAEINRSDSESGSQLPCDQLLSPIALAACARVDSCFAPWLVPSLGVSLQLAQLDLHLCHHLEQLGTVPPRQLRPFLPDRKLPQEQEFLVGGAREPRVFLRQWSSGPRQCREFSFSTQLDCKLLEYRNLTHLQLLQPCALQGQAAATCFPQSNSLDVNVFVDPVFLNISQYAIHTADTALRSWQQMEYRAKPTPNKESLMRMPRVGLPAVIKASRSPAAAARRFSSSSSFGPRHLAVPSSQHRLW
ncbi:Vacuolar protein sorting-associated protein 13B [Liparis tanakae]|uniref:Vacuolar protein sorting-associated protein 13B n=1 Tax=Liparis tanakae TaxID=230148 RepID=A0A4Z2EVE4_9TELE|nr:Vacuolar protein sorting-associated protein 13B [Liparis tanakae]